MEQLVEQITNFLLDLGVVIGISIAGYLVIRLILLKLFLRFLRRYGVDEVFVRFSSIIFIFVCMFLVVLIALGVIGVRAIYLVATFSAIIIALVAAIQGWLRNVAAGLWMFLNRPFKQNDEVEIAGKQGHVEQISLLTTILRTNDNLKVTFPNRLIVDNIITNFDANPERRIELDINIAYGDDLEEAIGVIWEVIRADERMLTEPEPIVAVADLGLNGVKLHVRPWVKQVDFSATRYDLRRNIKLALDAHHITLPYQQVQLHNGVND
ncbi:MAG: mechanosensitive ion channel [Chloroflexota bacterium]|nr:MAG: mechanosensitive ion channel [Chloroflexota bacterium]